MEHSMMNYIERQAELLEKLLQHQEELIEPMYRAFVENDIKEVYFCGSGTSNHVGMFTSMYFNKYLKVRARAVRPHNFVYNENINPSNTIKNSQILVVGVSQSGTSISTINAILKAKEHGCKTLAFSEDNDSEMSNICDYRIKMQCEKEMVPPETQGYTTALLAGYLWAVTVANKLSYITDEDYADKLKNIDHLIGVLPAIVEDSKKWVKDNETEFLEGVTFYFMGHGVNFVTAYEGALKFGETNRVGFRPFETEEVSHVIDLAFDKKTYVMYIIQDNEYYDRAVEIAEFTKQVTDHVFVVSDRYENTKHDLTLKYNVDEELTPISLVVPFQVMGAQLAEVRGYDTSCYPYELNSIAHNDDYIFLK